MTGDSGRGVLGSVGLGLLAPLLPRETRRRLGIVENAGLSGATLLSGMVEGVTGLVLLVLGFILELRSQGGEEGHQLFGLIWFAYLMGTWKGRLGLLVMVEGVVRVLAGRAGVACGVFPAWLVEWAWLAWGRRVAAAQERDAPPDLVTREGDTVVIHAARDPGWDELITIDVDGVPLRVVGYEHDAGSSRPHVYRLTPIPPMWAVRGMVKYPPRAG